MFKVELDATGLQRKFAKLSDKRLARASATATNDATKRLQIEEQHDARSRFTIRNEFTIRQSAVINPFASVSQNRPFAEIGVGIGRVRPQRLLLSTFEEGGPRSRATGSDRSAIPVPGGPARPSFKAKVPQQYRYRNLRLRRKQNADARTGRLGTFEIKGVGVFKRKGPRDIEAVYLFERNQQVDNRLRFYQIARQFGPRFMREEFERQLNRAIREAGR